MLILDSAGVTRLSSRTKPALALVRSLVNEGLWPPIVPTMVLVEDSRRRSTRCQRKPLPQDLHRPVPGHARDRSAGSRARRRARTGSAGDALVVVLAEPGGTVLTGDKADIEALAAHASGVTVEVI